MLLPTKKLIKKIIPSPLKSRLGNEIGRVRRIQKLWLYIKTIGIDKLFWLIETIELEYGHLLSVREKKPLSKDGSPIPWYTYAAWEYLNQLDFQDKDIFEYGAGNSSLFWAERARSVTSVESDREWYVLLKKEIKPNQKLRLIEDEKNYVSSIFQDSIKYDIIAIDGIHRRACSQTAVQCLKAGGLIILDNSDWFPETARTLREAGLIQVDFKGMGPINYYTWTTSIFLERKFAIKSRYEVQPEHGIGSIIQVANPE